MSFVEDNYQRSAIAFQQYIDGLPGGMDRQIQVVWEEHVENGFVQDDLSQSRRFPVVCSADHERFFFVQVNPARAERRKPIHLPRLPERLASRNLSRLDLELIPYTSGFRQYPWRIQLNGRSYAVLSNPFPIAAPGITVASTLNDDPQGWGGSPDRLNRILADLCEMVRRAPSFLGFYNSLAGATVLDKNHFQLIGRGRQPWPLEKAFSGMDGNERSSFIDAARYPLAAWRFAGDAAEVVNQAVEVTMAAQEIAGDVATENYLATSRNNVVSLYYIPRDKHRLFARPELMIASLESFGEMIRESSSAEEFLFEYPRLATTLSAVRPYYAEDLARRCA